MRVEIWSDIACPWCYIGKARFEQGLAAFAHRDQVEVVHRSFELEPQRAKGDVVPVTDVLVEKYGRTPDEARAMEEDVAEVARGEDLEYSTAGREAGSTFDVHRLLHLARARSRQNELLDLAYHANFTEKRSVFDAETLVGIAVEAGLDEDEARTVLADSGAYADEVRADQREAAELGATGVPFFVLDRRYGVSGGQPAAVFTQALEQAWGARTPLTTLAPADDAAACGPDGCEVPQVRSDV